MDEKYNYASSCLNLKNKNKNLIQLKLKKELSSLNPFGISFLSFLAAYSN